MVQIAPAPLGISYKVNKLDDKVGNAILKHMIKSMIE